MKRLKWLRLMFSTRVVALGLLSLAVSAVIACSSDASVTPVAADTPESEAPLPPTATRPVEGPAPTPTAASIQVPEFDTSAFADINPNPEIRKLDPGTDLGFDPRDRIPRDAINPVYTPRFVSPDEAPLRDIELVMGLEINGDARAYPVGMMRIREMVNDEVGGTPVLVSW